MALAVLEALPMFAGEQNLLSAKEDILAKTSWELITNVCP